MGGGPEDYISEDYKTLFQLFENDKSMPIVGLGHITEYRNGNDYCQPYYYCSNNGCRDAQGDAEFMKCHIFLLLHRAAWLKSQGYTDPIGLDSNRS